jgi:hypothetical protein
VPNLESSSKESIDGIQSVILGLRESIDIVDIADESLLGGYIPSQLRAWRGSDFNYETDVYHFLVGIYEKEDSSSIGIFFEKLYNGIKRFLCCKRFNTCSIKEPLYYNSCQTCSKFLDNNIKNRFAKYLKILGYSIDDEGYVIANNGETVEIEHIVNEIRREASFDIVGEFLPEDVKTKGKEMSEAYILVYCMENSLRIFVEKICYNQYGDGYIQKIKMSTDLERKIKIRKAEEETNKWLSVRGGNDLFYLDLDDLGKIIQNNWDLFKGFFPSQNWIVVKIEEIAKCRNLIAHNSYIKTDDRKLLPLYYMHILKQIQEKYKAEKM